MFHKCNKKKCDFFYRISTYQWFQKRQFYTMMNDSIWFFFVNKILLFFFIRNISSSVLCLHNILIQVFRICSVGCSVNSTHTHTYWKRCKKQILAKWNWKKSRGQKKRKKNFIIWTKKTNYAVCAHTHTHTSEESVLVMMIMMKWIEKKI